MTIRKATSRTEPAFKRTRFQFKSTHPQVQTDPLLQTEPAPKSRTTRSFRPHPRGARKGYSYRRRDLGSTRLSQVRLAEVQEYEEQFGKATQEARDTAGRGHQGREAAVPLRRDPGKAATRSDAERAFRGVPRAVVSSSGSRKLIQRLAGSGSKLVPQDLGAEDGSVTSWERLRPAESRVAEDI